MRQPFEKIVVIIPAYNPDDRLLSLVDELLQNNFMQIVIVNDGSTEDGKVFSALEKAGKVKIVRHHVNLGKGRALKTAFNYILNSFEDCIGVITVDADGQHKLSDIQRCAAKLSTCYLGNQIILGCRQFDSSHEIPLRSRFGNLCTQYVLRYLCNIRVSDSQTGLRGIPMSLLPSLLKVTGEGYEYETNVLLEIVNMGGALIEIPVETVYEDGNRRSHFNPIRDSFKIYTVIFKYSLASLVSVLIDNITFIFLSAYFSNIYIMTYAGRTITALFNFTINKKVVFKKKGNVIRQGLQYICLVIISGSISAFCVSTLHTLLGMEIVPLRLIVELILYFFNFYVQKNLIFIGGGNQRANKDQ